MNWIEQIISFNRIRKFVREHRKKGISSFTLLSDEEKLIIYDDKSKDHKTLRTKY